MPFISFGSSITSKHYAGSSRSIEAPTLGISLLNLLPVSKRNQYVSSLILHIYIDYNKWLEAYKIAFVLKRDDGIHISVGKVYRLMKTLQLPQISTIE